MFYLESIINFTSIIYHHFGSSNAALLDTNSLILIIIVIFCVNHLVLVSILQKPPFPVTSDLLPLLLPSQTVQLCKKSKTFCHKSKIPQSQNLNSSLLPKSPQSSVESQPHLSLSQLFFIILPPFFQIFSVLFCMSLSLPPFCVSPKLCHFPLLPLSIYFPNPLPTQSHVSCFISSIIHCS